MVCINDIPMDVWVVILRFVNKHNLINTFNKLLISRAINIPLPEKLNTFWIVVSQSRYIDTQESFDCMPDAQVSKHVFYQLKDMGIHEARASELVREANGNLYDALEILGWA